MAAPTVERIANLLASVDTLMRSARELAKSADKDAKHHLERAEELLSKCSDELARAILKTD